MTEIFDPCAGGHVGMTRLAVRITVVDATGAPCQDPFELYECTRCGRVVELSPCGCGTDGHEDLGWSSCREITYDTYNIERPHQHTAACLEAAERSKVVSGLAYCVNDCLDRRRVYMVMRDLLGWRRRAYHTEDGLAPRRTAP